LAVCSADGCAGSGDVVVILSSGALTEILRLAVVLAFVGVCES